MKTLSLLGLSALVSVTGCNISTDGLSEGNLTDGGYRSPDFGAPTSFSDAGGVVGPDGSRPGENLGPHTYAGCDVDSACTDGCAEDLDCDVDRATMPPPSGCDDADAGAEPCVGIDETRALPTSPDAAGGATETAEIALKRGEWTVFTLGERAGSLVARADLSAEQGRVDARVVDGNQSVLGRTAAATGLDASGFAFMLAAGSNATLELVARDADVTFMLELAPQSPAGAP
jgi:hypothetical protein